MIVVTRLPSVLVGRTAVTMPVFVLKDIMDAVLKEIVIVSFVS